MTANISFSINYLEKYDIDDSILEHIKKEMSSFEEENKHEKYLSRKPFEKKVKISFDDGYMMMEAMEWVPTLKKVFILASSNIPVINVGINLNLGQKTMGDECFFEFE